jgi:ankyrin repeat protein
MRHIKKYEEHAKTQQQLDREFIGSLFDHPDLERAKSLLRQGANVDARIQSGDTALHFAAEYSPRMVEFLCDNGADIEAVSAEGKTPLQHAKMWADCAQILLMKGADPTSAFNSMDDLVQFFDGDVRWMPKESLERMKKVDRSNKIFGRG